MLTWGGFSLGVIGIIISYVVIAVLLLSLNLASRWMWWVKAMAIIVTAGFFYESYVSLNNILGYATEQPPPERFQILWMLAREPDKKTADPGAIFLWADELGPDNRPRGNPRAYKLPYDRPLHKESSTVRQQIGEEGMEMMGTTQLSDKDSAATGSNPAGAGQDDMSSQFKIEEMPAPPMIPKESAPTER